MMQSCAMARRSPMVMACSLQMNMSAPGKLKLSKKSKRKGQHRVYVFKKQVTCLHFNMLTYHYYELILNPVNMIPVHLYLDCDLMGSCLKSACFDETTCFIHFRVNLNNSVLQNVF